MVRQASHLPNHMAGKCCRRGQVISLGICSQRPVLFGRVSVVECESRLCRPFLDLVLEATQKAGVTVVHLQGLLSAHSEHTCSPDVAFVAV